jgi:hypothetical protein
MTIGTKVAVSAKIFIMSSSNSHTRKAIFEFAKLAGSQGVLSRCGGVATGIPVAEQVSKPLFWWQVASGTI